MKTSHRNWTYAMSSLIEEKDVSLITLSLALEQASIAHTLQDEKKIYVGSQDMEFPFWLNLNAGSSLILFNTYVEFDEKATNSERHAFCNQVNSQMMMPSVHEHNGRLYSDYAMSYRDGLIRSQFVRMCRFYSVGVESVARRFDPDHALLRPLG